MKLFWLSWYEYARYPDYRPIADPPAPEVLCWWCTGSGGGEDTNDAHFTIVAYVAAADEDVAWKAVDVSWPNGVTSLPKRPRFCEQRAFARDSDRFPLTAEIRQRVEKAGFYIKER